MVAGRPKLGDFLVHSRVITQKQLEAALQHQADNGCRLGEALIALGVCSEAAVSRALAQQLEVPFVDLEDTPPSPDCIALLPRDIALEYGILPVRMQGQRLLVVVRDPYDIRVDDAVRQATNLQVILAIAAPSQLREQLQRHYSEGLFEEDQPAAKATLVELDDGEAPVSVEKLIAAGEQVSTVRVVNTMIADAVRRGASDLHLEPTPRGVRVRYRIDGQMCPILTLPNEMLPSVVARLKILCSMDIAENRRPQDGGCTVRVDSRPVELRASTIRSVHGETVVLRLLSQDAGLQRLDALGFQPEMNLEFRRLLAARHGMVLVTGPTGSGKTTSLYAALSHLNQDNVKIITVEDPVENKLFGITQIQVHDRAGRSFAATLRSVLRQDPDVIMVGEIRDAETAEIAARAALTGHLVLSTLHTQHALGTVARLVDMGLEPWLLAACLNGVLAQRLVRRICGRCGAEHAPPPELLRALESQFGRLAGARFHKGKGCSECHRTGARGRVGVYELLTVDERARQLLAKGAGSEQLAEHVLERGFQSMEQDAFQKACAGLIAPEEIVYLGFGTAMAAEESDAEPDQTPAALPVLPCRQGEGSSTAVPNAG